MGLPTEPRAAVVSLALMLMLACERDGTDTSSESLRPTSLPTGTSTIEAPAGSYRYEGLGVTAVVTFDGTSGELEVRNGTNVQLGEPHLYLFRADDGERIDLTTRDPEVVPSGADLTFEVFPDAAPPVGMVFLMFGQDDFGAFVPVDREAAG